MMTVASHNDSVLEFIIHGLLNFHSLWGLTCEFYTFLSKTHHLFVDKFEAIVDREILAYVVDDQVDAALEDP